MMLEGVAECLGATLVSRSQATGHAQSVPQNAQGLATGSGVPGVAADPRVVEQGPASGPEAPGSAADLRVGCIGDGEHQAFNVRT